MAITKTRKVTRIEIIPQDGDMKPVVNFYYEYSVDDPEDDELPIVTQKPFSLMDTTKTPNDDGTVTESPTDLTGHDPLVQTICNAVWSE